MLGSPNLSVLKDLIRDEIQQKGSIPLSRYIELCLYHPQYGYYMTGTPVGKKGAFITAPEISQVFGELIGLWVVDVWQRLGKPSVLNLVELGAGRGTLMADLLRYTTPLTEFRAALKVHLVEISPVLRHQQQTSLKNHSTVQWHDSVEGLAESLSSDPVIFIANEFLDAFPFDQYIFSKNHWNKRCIGFMDDRFMEAFEKSNPPVALLNQYPRPTEGDVLEYSASCRDVFQGILDLIVRRGGAGLFIDYGYNQFKFGDSFQALNHHAYCDPFQSPGEADLTHHINFKWYKLLAQQQGLKTSPLITQREFLNSMGITLRAHQLHEKGAVDVFTDVQRLTGDMGELFKVLVVYS